MSIRIKIAGDGSPMAKAFWDLQTPGRQFAGEASLIIDDDKFT